MTLGALSELTGAAIHGDADPDKILDDVATLDKAGPDSLSFLDNKKYRASFKQTRAGAVFAQEKMIEYAPENTAILVTNYPYKAYALAASAFYPEPRPESGIADGAFIDPLASIGKGCSIGHGAVIGANAVIGDHSRIEPNAVIGAGVQIGESCRIGAGAVLSHCILGRRVRLYPGVKIGQDGFGFAIDPSGHVKVPQLGRVIIGDLCEIGAGTCIDRGAGPDTVIGAGTWIDNLVQIAHNVQIGKGCIIVSQVGIAGSAVLEDYAVLGGQAGVAGHLRVGRGARIAAQSGIMRDVPAGQEMMGSPALPIRQYMRQVAFLGKMIKKEKS
jgi:UDP-3-O-[3-hydroxymyristoyl] glucosamine N-acyltransferase